MNRGGDRFGGVVFDIQQFRKGDASYHTSVRMQLIAAASLLIEAIEKMDDEELRRCDDVEHDRYGQRRSDCRECMGVLATMADVDDIVAKRERAQGKSTDSTHVENCTCVFAGHASEVDPRCLARVARR